MRFRAICPRQRCGMSHRIRRVIPVAKIRSKYEGGPSTPPELALQVPAGQVRGGWLHPKPVLRI